MDLHPGPAKCRMGTKFAELDPIRSALQENEDWYQDLVEHSHDLLCIHDLAGRLLSVNPAPARLLGYSVEEILRIPMREMIAPEYHSEFDAYLEEIQRVGESRGLLHVVTRSGDRRIWEYRNTLRSKGVASPIVRGMAHDITEQEETGKLLLEVSERLLSRVRENETAIGELKLFRALLDESNDAIEVVNPDTLRFLDVNGKACSVLGYSREELLSMGVLDIDPVVNELSAAAVIQELRKSGSMVLESLHRRKDGSTFPVEVSLRRVQIERDYIVAIARDLTERKLVEEALRRSEARERSKANELETVLDAVPVAVFLARDADCRYISTNRMGYEQLRLSRGANISKSTLLGKDLGFRIVRDGIEVPAEELPMQRAAATASPVYNAPYSLIFEDGTERHELFSAVPLLGEDGSLAGVVGASMDVTERTQAEARLREYERVVEGLEEMITVVDRDYRYVIANREFLKRRGLNREQLLGRNVMDQLESDGMSKEALAQVKEKMDDCFQGRVVEYELTYQYQTLGPRDLFLSYFPIKGPRGIDRIACVLRDITERKLAEQKLRESEAYLAEAQRLTHTGSGAWAVGGRDAVHLSEEWYRIYGFDPKEGLSAWEKRLQRIHPEDRDRVEEAKDRAIREKSGYEVNHRIVLPEGKVKYTHTVGRPVLNASGEVVQFVYTMMDITERKQAEEDLRRSEESYRMFVSQSSEGIFREEMGTPASVDLPEDELVHRVLYDTCIVECNDALAAMYGLSSAKELQGKHWTEMMVPDDPQNLEMARQFVRSGFRVLDRESHEVDIHGNRKVFLNSMIGMVENGMLVRTWGIQREITETVKLEESRKKAEEALRQNVAELQEVTEELRLAKEKLAEEKLYLEEAIDTELGFGEIIGRSRALKEVMAKVAKVAPSDATVLLLGETGTGKELVARALHRMSDRNGNSFIKLNCAAIPSGLLESELFGHERGAFTGAVARKLGRLELADRGTLFLDEIGEIPLSLQPKLLRVLQDLEFERLGGTQTLKVNFRLLAATNRDLLQSVKAHEFRSDLYYRLNVFPIYLPPLRERREDIRALVEHFVRKFADRMRRSITSIPTKAMEALVRWNWPGNIRELENFIERSVILTPGSVLQAPLSELQTDFDLGNGSNVSLVSEERERILRALRDCHGQLGGPDGAAARLGLKRTTLQSKLDHLGIKPGGYRA